MGPRTATALGLALSTVALAGCGGGTDSYCATLRSDRSTLTALAGTADPDAHFFERTLTTFTTLRSRAPEDVVDAWDTVILALRGLRDALDRAGVPPADLTTGHRPAGVTRQQMTAIRSAAEQVGSAQVSAASSRIEQHARAVCHVDLPG